MGPTALPGCLTVAAAAASVKRKEAGADDQTFLLLPGGFLVQKLDLFSAATIGSC